MVCRTGITTLPESSDQSEIDVADITTGIIGVGLLTAGATTIFNRWRLRRNKSSKNVGKIFDIAKDIDFRSRDDTIYRRNHSMQQSSMREEKLVYGDSDQYTEIGVIRQTSLASAGNLDGDMDYK